MANEQQVSSSAGSGHTVPSPQKSDVSKALDGQARSAEKELRDAKLREAGHDGVPSPEDTSKIEQSEGDSEPLGSADS